MKPTINDKGIVWDDDGNLTGLALGWDMTAEHQQGISELQHRFGVDNNQLGEARRKIKKVPRNIIHVDRTINKTSHGVLVLPSDSSTPKITKTIIRDCYQILPTGDDEFYASWDSKSFAILTKNKQITNELYEAFKKLDIYIGLFRKDSNPFANDCLSIIIASRLPHDIIDIWKQQDIELLKQKT